MFHNIKIVYFYLKEKLVLEQQGISGYLRLQVSICFFVDADDYIFPKILAGILKIIETQDLDVLRFNYENLNDGGKVIPKKKNATKSVVFSNDTVDGSAFLYNHLGWACYAWSFLFKTSFIKENNLIFNPTIYFEDVEWLLTVLLKAKKYGQLTRKFTLMYNTLVQSPKVYSQQKKIKYCQTSYT